MTLPIVAPCADRRERAKHSAALAHEPRGLVCLAGARDQRSTKVRGQPAASGLKNAFPLDAATAKALRGRAGNGALARMLAPRQIVLAREIKIDQRTYGAGDYRDISRHLSLSLNDWGYTTPSRLLKIVHTAVGRSVDGLKPDERTAAEDLQLPRHSFETWDKFIEYLANNGYTSGVLPQMRSKKRPYTLGKRPRWIPAIEHARKTVRKGSAARHIIPSHFLGYAVEKWNPTSAAIRNWIEEARKIDPVLVEAVVKQGQVDKFTDVQLKRCMWQILNNHRGNLWWGDKHQNTTIGFFAPHMENVLHKMRKAQQNSKLTVELATQLIAKVPHMKGSGEVANWWNEIREQLSFIAQSPSHTDDKADIQADILERAEEVFYGMELDPSAISDWPNVKKMMDELEKPDGDGKQFLTFLGTIRTGTIK